MNDSTIIASLRTEKQQLQQQLEQLQHELDTLRQHQAAPAAQHSVDRAAPSPMLYRNLFEALPDAVLVVTPQGTMDFFNQRFVEMWGIPAEIVASRSDEAALGYVIDQLADPEGFIGKVQYLYSHPEEYSRDDVLLKDGRIFDRYSAPVSYGDGFGSGRVWFFRDVTERRQAEEEVRANAVRAEVLEAQRSALRELSTPLIPISDSAVVMPLIGTIDSQRAQQIMETLLEGVAQHQAALVILDITGVAVVDTQVAQGLVQATQAVKLLGAQVILTGIQPQIAQTLVHLGVDLQGIQTRSSLQSGIAAALHHGALMR